MLTPDIIKSQVKIIQEAASNFLVDTAILKHRTGQTVVKGENITTYSSKEIAIRFITKSGDDRTNVAAQERLTQFTTYTGIYRAQVSIHEIIDEGDIIEYTDTNNTIRKFTIVYAPPVHELTGAYIIVIKEIT